MRRRNLLKAIGAGTAGLALAPSLVAKTVAAYPFAIGVAAGDPSSDGFVIWTRLVTAPLEEHGGIPAVRIPVGWELASDERFANVVARGEAIANPELGHSVHVEVQGLPFVGPLDAGGSAPVDLLATPREAGQTELVLDIAYRDDFNQTQILSRTLSVEIIEGEGPMPGQEGMPAPGEGMPEMPETPMQKVWRAIKGFFGLGS